MLVKVGCLARSGFFEGRRHHTELVAIRNLMDSTKKDCSFVFVGTTDETQEQFQKDNYYEYDLKTGSFTATLTYLLQLTFLLFKLRPKRVIAFNDWIFPISLYCLVTRNAKYSLFYCTGFKYWGTSKLGKVIYLLLWRFNWTCLQLSRFKLNGVYALSRYTQNGIIQNASRLKEKVRLISYPIDPIFKRSTTKAKDILLVVAAITPRKGLHTLVRAMPHINSHARLIVKGHVPEPGYLLYLQQLARRLKVGDRIEWKTRGLSDEELAILYGKAKLFVFPTLEDALGVVVLEALHCGLPVVGTDGTGVTDMVVDGENGLLVPPNDPAGLARAINTILDDEKLYGALTQNTVNVLMEHYYRGRLTIEQAMKRSVSK
jgi:glycosyltransferase involved in cell wall biosynthesis